MDDTNLQERLRSERAQERERRTKRRERAMQVPVVTQNMPDDAFDGQGPIIATYGDTAPTQRELEQDVTMTNPSVESMDGRG